MPPVFLIVRDICLLRKGPQDLPHSRRLLGAFAAACVVVQIGVATVRDAPVGSVIAGGVLWLVFTLGVLQLMLSLRGLRHRFIQAGTALLACTLIFTLLTLPVALLAGEPPVTPDQLTPIQLLLGVISLPLLIWKIMVDAHVFRHSLDIPFLAGIGIALLWIVAAIALAGFSGTPAA